MNEIDPPNWKRSTKCSGGQCVEVTRVDGNYLIRDSKRPDLTPLSFTAREWSAFVEGVKAGEFRF